MSDIEIRLWIGFVVVLGSFIKGYQFYKEGKF